MSEPRSYSRHGQTAPMVRIRLQGFKAIDRRTKGGREAVQFRNELANALGGTAELSPQKAKLVDLAARASLMLDHVDCWLVGQTSLINRRSKTLLPVLVQRQGIAEHLSRLLEKLGLDRVPTKVLALDQYLADRYAGDGAEGHRDGPGSTRKAEAHTLPSDDHHDVAEGDNGAEAGS